PIVPDREAGRSACSAGAVRGESAEEIGRASGVSAAHRRASRGSDGRLGADSGPLVVHRVGASGRSQVRSRGAVGSGAPRRLTAPWSRSRTAPWGRNSADFRNLVDEPASARRAGGGSRSRSEG